MTTTTTETKLSSLDGKVRELCEFLVSDPDFAAAQGQIKQFEEDEAAQDVFHDWQSKASEIHQGQQHGRKPTGADLEELEALQKKVADNPVAADFLEANDSMNDMFGKVVKTVQKTFQLGRIPTEEEMSECCGEGG